MTAASGATAVIAAAGSGERLGAETPKALVELAGRPMVAWSIDAFARSESVGAIIVAAPGGFEAEIGVLGPPEAALDVVTGGPSRAESVAAAVARARTGVIVIHDAARPLVTPGLIDEVVGRLGSAPEAAGVIAAAPITDTVKRADAPHAPGGAVGDVAPPVVATEPRELLWAAQTPQAFRAGALREALAASAEGLAAATDEAMLVERAGGMVLIHPSGAGNLKVTTADDLRIAALLLARD